MKLYLKHNIDNFHMYILSFDIGTKNLAYCYSRDEHIIKWAVLDIHDKDIYLMTDKCLTLLHETFESKEIDCVLLENQPAQKNPKMKSVQMIVFTYFAYKKTVEKTKISKILFQSANNKNKYAKSLNNDVFECKSKYQENKKKAIACAKDLLPTEWLEYFLIHKKKDDLADSYLQMLAYINYTPVLPKPDSPRSVVSSSSTTST